MEGLQTYASHPTWHTPCRMRVEWSQSTPSMDTQIITIEQDYNKARGSHVTKRVYTEVLAKPTK